MSFQKLCFLFSNFVSLCPFRLIQPNFWSIEIVLNFFKESLSVSIDRNWFSINRNSWIKFLKISVLTCSSHFFKTFSKPSLSLRLGKALQRFFCRFQPIFLQGFSLHKPVCPYYPLFFIYFMFYMHFFMHWRVIFELSIFWGFLMIQTVFCEIDHWVFVPGCYNHDPCGLIWSILWVFEELKILWLVINPSWRFCSNLVKLMKLACWFDVIGHYFLKSILYDDQLVNVFQIDQMVFQIFGFYLYVQANFVNLNLFGLNCTALGHASCHLNCSCII